MSAILFYPTVTTAFPCGGVHERHSQGMLARTLREQALGEIPCLLDHDPTQLVGSTKRGSLRLTLEARGLRAELDIHDDTPPGRRLAEAAAAGSVTGASFLFRERRVRWHLDAAPRLREFLDVDLLEVTLTLAPRRPANGSCWAAALGPGLQRRYAALRARIGAAYRPPAAPPADLELRLPRLRLTRIEQMLGSTWCTVAYERKAVEAARAQNPTARLIDILYPRNLAELHAAHARHTVSLGGPTGTGGRRTTSSGPAPGRLAIGPDEFLQAQGTAPSPRTYTRSRPMSSRDPLRLLPISDRRELPGPCLPAAETCRRLTAVVAALERRLPGGARWIEHFRPYTDRRGVWHPGAVLRSGPRPLSLRECLEKHEGRDW